MPNILFIEPSGAKRHARAGENETLLSVAQQYGVEGILGDCGGNCACATCHIYVEGKAVSFLSAPAEDEQAMLEGALHYEANSRLACQIRAGAALDELIARMPPS